MQNPATWPHMRLLMLFSTCVVKDCKMLCASIACIAFRPPSLSPSAVHPGMHAQQSDASLQVPLQVLDYSRPP